MAADRNSRLKEGITAEELETSEERPKTKRMGLVGTNMQHDSGEAGYEEMEEEEFDDDDFLARDLQEEWG